MVEQRPVKSEVVGSNPTNIAKTRWLNGLKQQIANLFFAGSNPVLVSNYGSIEQLVGSPDCKSGSAFGGLVGSSLTASTKGIYGRAERKENV